MEDMDNHTPKSVTFSEIGPNELFEYDFRGNICNEAGRTYKSQESIHLPRSELFRIRG